MNIPFPPVPQVKDPNLQAYLEQQRVLLVHWLQQVSLDPAISDHEDLTGILGGAADDHYHITNAQLTDLTDGNASTAHKHDHGGQDGLGDHDHTQYALVVDVDLIEDFLDFTRWRTNDPNTGTLVAGNPSLSAATDYDGNIAGYNWADGEKRASFFQTHLRNDFDETQAITAVFIWRMSGVPSAGHNIVIQSEWRANGDNESPTTGGVSGTTSTTIDVAGKTSARLYFDSLGTFIAGGTVRAGDLLHGCFYRDAAHASDNYTGTVQAVGVLLTMTRINR